MLTSNDIDKSYKICLHPGCSGEGNTDSRFLSHIT
jgi:hypothetical protein